MTLLFSSLTTGWPVMLCSLVLQAHALDKQDQHVNTWVWLASTVTHLSFDNMPPSCADPSRCVTDLYSADFDISVSNC